MKRLVTQFDDARTRATVATPTCCCCCCCCCVGSILTATGVSALDANELAVRAQLPAGPRRGYVIGALSALPLGAVLAAFASTAEGGRRVHGSAGGTYPLEIFCLLNNCEGPAAGRVAYYNADNHSLASVSELPAWASYADAVNLDTGETVPQLVVVFVVMADRVTGKYGERGGRFALIEVGQAVQSLALRLVQEDLAGCALGGLLDHEIKRLLGLDGTGAQIALGYACGIAP